MFEIKPDIKFPRRAEIWGFIAVVCFNFAFLIAALLRIEHSGAPAFWFLVLLAEACFAFAAHQLLRFHKARAGIDDMYEATVATNKTQEILQKREANMTETQRVALQAAQELHQVKKESCPLKNFPPDS